MPYKKIILRKNTSNTLLASWFVAFLVLALNSGQAIAHDEPVAKKPKPAQHGWSGKVKLGLDSNAGNTNTRKVTVVGNAVHNKKFNHEKPLRHTLRINVKKGDFARVKGGERVDTTDKELASYRLDYFLNERSSVRAFGLYMSDKKAKIESLTQVGAGYEYDIIKTPHHTFNLGGGINHVSLEYNDGTPTIEGPAGRIALEYNGKLMENIRLTQKLAVLGMDDFTMKSSVTNLEYVFTRNVSVSLDHEITDYSRIARTSQEETETSTSLNLNFNF